jgi:hypothetical protein
MNRRLKKPAKRLFKGLVGRPRTHFDSATKQAAYRARKKDITRLRDFLTFVANDLFPNRTELAEEELKKILDTVVQRDPTLSKIVKHLKADIAKREEVDIKKTLAELKPYVPKGKAALSMNRGRHLTQAPQGKGELIYGHDNNLDRERVTPEEASHGYQTKKRCNDDGTVNANIRTPILTKNREEERAVARADAAKHKSPTIEHSAEDFLLRELRLIPAGMGLHSAIRKARAFLGIHGLTCQRFRALQDAMRSECLSFVTS